MEYKGHKYSRLTNTSFIDKLDAQTFGDSEFSTLIDESLTYSAPSSASYTGKTWYWDPSAPAGGDGSLGRPFTTLALANAASESWDAIVALGGGTLTSLPLVMDRLYDFSKGLMVLNGHTTLTGTGRIIVDGLITFATPDTTFMTIAANQGVMFSRCQILSSGTNTLVSLSGSGSELDLNQVRFENSGNAVVLDLGSGAPYVNLTLSTVTTSDNYAMTISSGDVTVGPGSSIGNDSASIPAVAISGTGRVDVVSSGMIHNDNSGPAVNILGATSSLRLQSGVSINSTGVAINKDNAGSTLYITPLGAGTDLGVITSGNIYPGVGSTYTYAPNDPSGVVIGMAGQFVTVPMVGNFLCKGGSTWMAV